MIRKHKKLQIDVRFYILKRKKINPTSFNSFISLAFLQVPSPNTCSDILKAAFPTVWGVLPAGCLRQTRHGHIYVSSAQFTQPFSFHSLSILLHASVRKLTDFNGQPRFSCGSEQLKSTHLFTIQVRWENNTDGSYPASRPFFRLLTCTTDNAGVSHAFPRD